MKKKLDLIALQIDLGRQKETVGYLKSYIDFAKANGYNSLFLYLEAAVKVECTPFFNADETYTPEEIKQIVAYGNEQGIDIIPALENLAHMENFLRHPELKFLAECEHAEIEGRGLRTDLGDCGCSSNPKAMAFMDTYYSQVISLFTSKYVHAGLDEPFDFAVCKTCTDRLENGETKADLFYEHVMRTYNLVKSFGKTMMMWDDFFCYLDIADRLPRDIILCNWHYGYIQDEIPGHWINYIKRDWFRYYDQLGFRYIFCTYANQTAKLFNTDTYTNYAKKYNPMGALMTVWERSSRLNLAGYPAIAYTGRFWSGKITESDRVKVYTEFLGSEELAEIVLNLEVSVPSYQPNNLQICENSTLGRYGALNVAEYALKKMKKAYDAMKDGLQKDILLDIYTLAFDNYLGLVQQKLCLEVFDNYESRAHRPAYFTKKILALKEMSQELYTLNQKSWDKYRPGIKSFLNQFENKYVGRAKRFDDMIVQLEKNEKRGVFYADLMIHCPYGTPHLELEIHYRDKSVPVTVHKTNPKVSEGVNTIRFDMENKAVDYAVVTVYGEGAAYPVNFRYTYGGKKYIASAVSKLTGEAKNLKRILTNDTQFAELGNNDGYAHFADVRISKMRHQIKLKFKKLK